MIEVNVTPITQQVDVNITTDDISCDVVVDINTVTIDVEVDPAIAVNKGDKGVWCRFRYCPRWRC